MTTQPTPISLGQASKKYHIPEQTLSRWARRGLLTVLKKPTKRGEALLVDEREVALAYFRRVPRVLRGT